MACDITQFDPIPEAIYEIEIIWRWSCDRIYAKGDICWLGTDPATDNKMDWESLQDNNINYRPVMYGTEPTSPEWWKRIR